MNEVIYLLGNKGMRTRGLDKDLERLNFVGDAAEAMGSWLRLSTVCFNTKGRPILAIFAATRHSKASATRCLNSSKYGHRRAKTCHCMGVSGLTGNRVGRICSSVYCEALHKISSQAERVKRHQPVYSF